MTQPIIHDEPARGTVDYYRSRLVLADDVNDLYARSIGLITSVVMDFAEPETVRLQRVECVVDLVIDLTSEMLQASRQAPIGFDYSREEDPTPVSPARGGPVHTGAVVDGDVLVDVTPDGPLERVRTTDGGYRVLELKGVGTGSLTWDPFYGDYGIVVASGPLSTLFDPAIEARKCCALMENCSEADMFAHLESLYWQLASNGGQR
jgi:hypothetical protein